ncbi:hypothetical protein [Bacteroides propionicifaciens]|uniref:hypothetical protein n=1 Tax=Bacteroides propionicifaciens TaxID=392838 RepID=UPI0003A687E7|nr:hypothetical protein [Bacteroides propionicifaciens]
MKLSKYDLKAISIGIITNFLCSFIFYLIPVLLTWYSTGSFSDAFRKTLEIDVKLWVILIGVFLVLTISTIIRNIKPRYVKYMRDTFNNETWIWKWTKKKDGSYAIDKLAPLCSKDHTLMFGGSYYNYHMYICPQCGQKYDTKDLIKGGVLGMIKNNVFKNYSVYLD